MNISLVTPAFSVDRKGGIENHIFALARELNHFGHRVTIIYISPLVDSSISYDCGCKLKVVPIKSYGTHTANAIFNILRFAKALQGSKIVHIHDPSLGVITLISIILKFFIYSNAKLVHSSHGYWFHNNNSRRLRSKLFERLYLFYSKQILLLFDFLIAVSNSDLTNAYNILGSSRHKVNITTVENPIDFFGSYSNPCTFDISHNLLTSDIHILSLGRNVDHKNYKYSISLLKKVADSFGLSIVYNIVGEKTDILKNISTDNFKLFAHGPLNHKEIVSLAAISTFVCSLSSFEGFGLSMLELMHLGLIPIYSNISAFHRLRGQGFGIEINLQASEDLNATSLASYLRKRTNSSLLNEKSKSSQYTQHLGWRSNIIHFLEIYTYLQEH